MLFQLVGFWINIDFFGRDFLLDINLLSIVNLWIMNKCWSKFYRWAQRFLLNFNHLFELAELGVEGSFLRFESPTCQRQLWNLNLDPVSFAWFILLIGLTVFVFQLAKNGFEFTNVVAQDIDAVNQFLFLRIELLWALAVFGRLPRLILRLVDLVGAFHQCWI